MDGQRLRDYWSSEVEALLAAYKQFETLLPNSKTAGAAHRGEDGRFVEDLLRSYLRKYLPKDLEVLTGFILRPAVKTSTNGRQRAEDDDGHSTQLDILIYDTANYPVFQRFGDSVIVPPEGVVAIISAKKTLNDGDIETECRVLHDASILCRSDAKTEEERSRGPFLALVGPQSAIEKTGAVKTHDWIFQKLQSSYVPQTKFDDLIGLISDLSNWSIFKTRPEAKPEAKYLYFNHASAEKHLGFQFIISGILSVYYDKTRRQLQRPGFTAFPRRSANKRLGVVPYEGLR
jgi:hypothetical protein